jgi:cystathionine beta-synthase
LDTILSPVYLANVFLTKDVLDRSLVDTWLKTGDQESFTMSRRLIRTEGLLCGGSSGSAVVGAIKIAKQLNLGKDKTVVVVLPDSLRNYITKVASGCGMLTLVLG